MSLSQSLNFSTGILTGRDWKRYNSRGRILIFIVIGPYILSIFCILGLVGNSLVIVTYAFYKRIKCMTDIYLINVAIADLLFVLVLPFIVYNELWSWPMGQVACKLLRGSYSVNLYSGMLLFACISTDRYIAIAQVRRLDLRYTRFRPHLLLLSVVRAFEGPATAGRVAAPITQISVGFFLPLFITIFCFSGIIITLLKTKNLQHHREVWEMLVVVAVFIICHPPYNIVLLYDTVTMFQERSCDEGETLEMALTVSQTIAYLHCCLNPMLYALVGVNFRNQFRRIFRDLWCLGKAPRRFSRVTTDFYMSSTLRSMDESSNSGASFTM
uniref:Chemokine (C-C motif) receptor 6a n=1 Tax=Neolamprologus brichardi TaxID=32507 RepID=A0A3Q4GJ73_NEOBR